MILVVVYLMPFPPMDFLRRVIFAPRINSSETGFASGTSQFNTNGLWPIFNFPIMMKHRDIYFPGNSKATMCTIEEIYSALISEGVSRNFSVVPKFSIPIAGYTRPKKFDLVWLKKREILLTEKSGSLKKWIIVAAFEIEGCDVPIARVKKHVEQLLAIQQQYRESFPTYMPLYTMAFHRTFENWDLSAKSENLIATRHSVIGSSGGNDVLKILTCNTSSWTKDIKG